MTNVEVHIDLPGGPRRVGMLFRYARHGGEAVAFKYHNDWLADRARFPLEPGLALNAGVLSPAAGHSMFGSFGDSAPDTWGRKLLQLAEQRRAEHEGRAVRTLAETDYLLGVADVWRQGALRFRNVGTEVFETNVTQNAPKSAQLGPLIGMIDRILRKEEAEDDLYAILALGASLGGARPKTSIVDQNGHLSIAKFPKSDDDYAVERWEAVALRLARMAGINAANHQLLDIDGRSVLLSRRFDRSGATRIPFLSALSLLGLKDGERGSYPELVEVLVRHGTHASRDATELYRRMVLNILISNVDDHLRNQGFLWSGAGGWTLSPAYDLNPTPVDVKAHILSTNIDLDTGTCNLELALSVAELFNLKNADARTIIKTVAEATRSWREVAASLGAKALEIRRMESAFEHERLAQALAL